MVATIGLEDWRTRADKLQRYCAAAARRRRRRTSLCPPLGDSDHDCIMDPAITLLIFSVLMAAVPLLTFVSAWQGTLDVFLSPLLGHLLENHRLAVAGVLGALAVNLVLAAFVALAWLERPPPSRRSDGQKES